MFDRIARIGVMGVIAIIVVGGVVFLAGYSVVTGIDNENTTSLIAVLATGAGGVLGAVGRFLGDDGQQGDK